jgi:hypothetical protein
MEPATPVAPPPPAPKPAAEQAPKPAPPAPIDTAIGRPPRAVDALLREVAAQLQELPLANDPWIRSLNLGVLGTKAPGPVRDIWVRYGQQIPDSYRSLTVGQLLDQYGR